MNSVVKAAVFSVVLLLVIAGVAVFLLRDRPGVETPEQSGVSGVQAELPPRPVDGARPAPKPLVRPQSPDEVAMVVRVVDQATKKLLPRSSLLVQKVTDGDRPGEKVYESGRRAPGASTGEFQLAVAPGVYQIRGQCPGHGGATMKVTIVKDRPPPPYVLELGSGFSISGRVLARDGRRGVGEARVMAYPQIGHAKQTLIERLINITKVTENAQKPPAETVSAEDGSYQIDGLDRQHYTVKAVAAGYSPAEIAEVLPTRDGVDFALAVGGELPGMVVETTGAPVPGARVHAHAHDDSADLFAIIETRSRPPFDTVTTGADGSFKFMTLGAGTYNFLVNADGFQEGRFLKIRVREGENAAQRFAIARGLTISGTVVSQAGEPVANAKVRATRLGDSGKSEQMFIRFGDGSIRTDDQGKFVFNTLEPGKYTLLAWHQDHASEQRRDVDAGTEDLVITLPMGGAIEGVVTEAGSGKAVAGARISVSDMQDLRKEDVTDEQGHYYVGGLNVSGQGKRYMNIHAEGYARLSNLQVQVEDGRVTAEQNHELHRTAMVSGRVVDANQNGVSEARVMAKRKTANSPVALTVGSAVTGADGRFQIKDLDGGEETTVTVMTGDYLETESAPFTAQPGESVEIPDLVLQLGGMIDGVVVGSDNRPVAGVSVAVRKEGETTPDVALSATSGVGGKFQLRGLAAGTVDLVVKSIHHLEEVVSGVKVQPGMITQDVKIVLRQGASVRGTVVDSDGRAVREAQIVAQDLSETGGLKELRAESDQNGMFAIENIQSTGTIEVTVEHPEYGSWSSSAVAANTQDLKVELPKLGGVRAQVVDAQGSPVPSFSVQPQPRDGGEGAGKRLQAKTFQTGPANRDGSFTYSGIPAGVYDIHVRAPSYAVFTFSNVEVGGRVLDLGRAELQEGGTINGVVVNAAGRAIPGVSVRVLGGLVKFNNISPTPRGNADQSIVVTDNRGFFEFRNLKSGSVSLQFTAKGFVTKRLEDLDPNVADKSRDLKVVLEEGAEIFGTVIDKEGNAKNGVSVYLKGQGELASHPDASQRTATNSEGSYRFSGLSAGTYSVTALGDGSRRNPSFEVEVESGAQQEVELVFE